MCSGTSPDDRLVEFIELPDHPFFVGTQAHPEFKSRPDRPHPLFAAFVQAARDRAEGRAPRLPVVDRADRDAAAGATGGDATFRVVGSKTLARRRVPRRRRGCTSRRPTARSSTATSCTIPARSSWCRSTPTARRAAGAPVPRRRRARAARGPGGQARRRRASRPRPPRPASSRRRSATRPAGSASSCEFYNSPGFSDEYTHLFLATELEERDARRGESPKRRR